MAKYYAHFYGTDARYKYERVDGAGSLGDARDKTLKRKDLDRLCVIVEEDGQNRTEYDHCPTTGEMLVIAQKQRCPITGQWRKVLEV
jgi:hypothetical protein